MAGNERTPRQQGLRRNRSFPAAKRQAEPLEGTPKRRRRSLGQGEGSDAFESLGRLPHSFAASSSSSSLPTVQPETVRRSFSSDLLLALFPGSEVPAEDNAAPAVLLPTVMPAIKNVSVEYIRAMLLEVIRDGEVSESERKILLWSIIILAQLREKFPDDRIPVPSSSQALSRYMDTQSSAIMKLMCEVQKQESASGVRESIFSQSQSPRRGAWAEGLDAEPGGHADRALAEVAQRGLGYLLQLAGTEELVRQVTPAELLLACEPPQDVDLFAHHGPVVAACLGSLGPIVPQAYMFKQRAADFHRLCYSKGSIDLEILPLALRFFLTAFVYAQLRKVPSFLIGALYARVFICSFDERIWVLGQFVQLLRFIAEKATDWDKNDEWVGCPDDGTKSAIQWLPDKLAELITSWFQVRHAAFFWATVVLFGHIRSWLRPRAALAVTLVLSVCTAALVEALDEMLLLWGLLQGAVYVAHPVLRASLNYMFAVLLAKLLIRVTDIVDEVVQPKLVLMSLKLAARTRDAVRQAECPRGRRVPRK